MIGNNIWVDIMLGLELRDEFKGRRLKGTAIELSNKNQTGATQVSASEFLQITYPTGDVLQSIEAVGPQAEPAVRRQTLSPQLMKHPNNKVTRYAPNIK